MKVKEYLISGIITLAIAGVVVGVLLKKAYLSSKFQNAKTIEARVTDQIFIPGNNMLFGRQDTYDLTIKLPNGQTEVFDYEGDNARKIWAQFRKSNSVSYKEGFKPGDNF